MPLRRSRLDTPHDRHDHRPSGPTPRPVELFPPPPRDGSRFDDTIALPMHAPRRLEQALALVASRLAELPTAAAPTHRTISYRSQLAQIHHDVKEALFRLRAGAYGTCADIHGAIMPMSIDHPLATDMAGSRGLMRDVRRV